MTELDDTLIDSVYDTIQTYGKEVTFYTVSDGTGGSYDPNTGIWTAGSLPVGVSASYTYKVSPPENHNRSIDGTDSVGAVLSFTLPSKNLNANLEADYLRIGMKIKLDSSSSPQSIWRITDIRRLYSGESVCAYEITCSQQSGN